MNSRRGIETNNALLIGATGFLERASMSTMQTCGIPPAKAGDLFRAVLRVMRMRSRPSDERLFAIHARATPTAFARVVAAVAKLNEPKPAERLKLWHRLALHRQRARETAGRFMAVGGVEAFVPEKLSKAEERAVEELVKRYRDARRKGFIPD